MAWNGLIWYCWAQMFPARDIKIGTSGYSYPGPPPKGWYGAFYPEKKTKGFEELKYYSQVFNTCEINSTFYRPPSSTVTTGWATKTPDDFSFAIKLWQKFTHPMKISGAVGAAKSERLWRFSFRHPAISRSWKARRLAVAVSGRISFFGWQSRKRPEYFEAVLRLS